MPPDPLVSVGMLTYNQEPFVRASVRSVLAQTLPDLELVVLDNGSTDGTAAAVAEFDDPRVRYVREERNRGPGWGLGAALAAGRGRYVALITGDDLCHPERLARQVAAHRQHGGVIFTNSDYVDEDGAPLVDGHYPKDFFNVPPMTRAEVLARFFYTGNFINTLTLFLERAALDEVGLFDPLLYQLQDLDLMVRLAKRHPFTFLPEPLVSWRIRRDGGNLSAPAPFKAVRSANELYLIHRRFFDDFPADLFREAFGAKFVNPDSRTPDELRCEQAFLFLRHPLPLARLLGAERLHGLLSDPATGRVLAERFRFTQAEFAAESGLVDVAGMNPAVTSYLVGDAGTGFDQTVRAACACDPAAGRFALTFDTSAFPETSALRWDVLPGRCVDVRVESVTRVDRDGSEHAAPVDALEPTTGDRTGPGAFRFRTLFPLVRLPVAGVHRSVTVTGTWAATDPARSAWEVDERARETARRAAGLAETAAGLAERVRGLTAHADALGGEVHARDARVKELAEAVAARDERIGGLGAEVAALDARARELAAAAGARDARARDLADAQRRGRFGPLVSTLFFDAGRGFRPEDSATAALPRDAGEFRLTFDLGGAAVQRLRWDPLEGRSCRVRIDAAEWTDAGGAVHRVDPAGCDTNGAADGAGFLAFDGPDPAVLLPVAGRVARVTVAGRYDVDDAPATIARLDDARGRALARAADLERAAAARDAELLAADDRVRALAERVRALATELEAVGRGARTSVLHVDTGGGFRAGDCRTQTLPDGPGPFRVTFAVAERGVRSVRWDPGQAGAAARVDAIEWTDLDGNTHRLPPAALAANGPALTLPIAGGVGRVTVAGWCG